MGTDTRRNALNASSIGDDFLTAVKESFNQQYQTFNLLVRFDNATVSRSAPVANVTTAASELTAPVAAASVQMQGNTVRTTVGLCTSLMSMIRRRQTGSCLLPAGSSAAAAANAAYSDLVTDRFNVHQQYEAIDIDVTAIAGSDLAARLPGSWLPLAKNTPLFENAMRQRGYLVRPRSVHRHMPAAGGVTASVTHTCKAASGSLCLVWCVLTVCHPSQVTCLTLDANVTAFAAQNVLNLLPSSNSTAVQMELQVCASRLLCSSALCQPTPLCQQWHQHSCDPSQAMHATFNRRCFERSSCIC